MVTGTFGLFGISFCWLTHSLGRHAEGPSFRPARLGASFQNMKGCLVSSFPRWIRCCLSFSVEVSQGSLRSHFPLSVEWPYQKTPPCKLARVRNASHEVHGIRQRSSGPCAHLSLLLASFHSRQARLPSELTKCRLVCFPDYIHSLYLVRCHLECHFRPWVRSTRKGGKRWNEAMQIEEGLGEAWIIQVW